MVLLRNDGTSGVHAGRPDDAWARMANAVLEEAEPGGWTAAAPPFPPPFHPPTAVPPLTDVGGNYAVMIPPQFPPVSIRIGHPPAPPSYFSHAAAFSIVPPDPASGLPLSFPPPQAPTAAFQPKHLVPGKAPPGRTPLLPAMVHSELKGVVDYLELPSHAELDAWPHPDGDRSTGNTEHGLFFGQVKFETTSRQMMWLLAQLTSGACVPSHMHPRGHGCFMAYYKSSMETEFVKTLNQSVLFDTRGVWIARTPEAREAMTAYLASGRAKVPRLPHGPMIIRV